MDRHRHYPQAVAGSFGGLAEQRLELGEGHLDRVHVGRVGRQQKELRALGLDRGAHGGDLVGCRLSSATISSRLRVGISTCST